ACRPIRNERISGPWATPRGMNRLLAAHPTSCDFCPDTQHLASRVLLCSAMRLLIIALALFAQSSAPPPTSFRARLSPVPVESSTASKITGSRTVTATLDGSKLSINGTFQGMKSPATIAQVHMGMRGVRGPVEFDLSVEKSPS